MAETSLPMGVADAAAPTVPDVPLPEPSLAERASALVDSGGPVVALLIVMSVLATTIVVAKVLQFRAARVGERRAGRAALAAYRSGRPAEAADALGGRVGPGARILALALSGHRQGVPEPRLREALDRAIAEEAESLASWLRPLEVIASLAPLLGLFGTVLGMIEAFRQMEAAGSQVDPAVLSGGIWQALLTTAVGLGVAIPVVAVLNALERAVERAVHDMDTIVAGFFAGDPAAQAPVKGERDGVAGWHPVAATGR